MRLGEHTIGLRRWASTGRDDYGNDIPGRQDTEVRGCLVYPTRSSETDDRATPRITGLTLLAPPGTDVEAVDAIVWPITGRTVVDGQLQLTGREYQVVGDVGIWEDVIEVQLSRVT